MTLQKIAMLFMLGSSVVACKLVQGQDIDYKGFPQWSWHKEDSTEYYLYTPSGMEPGKKYPVALFMHGCCGTDYHATLRNTVDPPVRMWHNFGANKQTVPTYIIAPATSKGWVQHFENIKKVIDGLIENEHADRQRIYVCGFSMGGEGTFRIIQQYPNYFAAAIPMGMNFSGDSVMIKDMPIWANQGETDWFSRSLKKQVAAIRLLNGYNDTGSTWITGVNPRYSNFKGVGHGVQWNAASTQDLTGWAYSKVNDGSPYPTVFFIQPSYQQAAEQGKPVQVEIQATTAAGSIVKIELYHNKKLVQTVQGPPFAATIIPVKGDNLLEAVAWNDKGKSAVATTLIKVTVIPEVLSEKLADATQGGYYEQQLTANGNGHLLFTTLALSRFPQGLQLYPNGFIKGIPALRGNFSITVHVSDENNEWADKTFELTVKGKAKNQVLVSSISTVDGKAYPLSKLMLQETPCFDSRDSMLTTVLNEINFSDIDKYDGLTYIKTDINDANRSDENFLSFTIDEDAIIYVAYEELERPKHSSYPQWLNDYTKEAGEIVAQYRYFAVFSKKVFRGRVTLPGAAAKANGVGNNYFVIVKKLNG